MNLSLFFAVVICPLAEGYFYTYRNPPLEDAKKRAALKAMQATPFEIGFLVSNFDVNKQITKKKIFTNEQHNFL